MHYLLRYIALLPPSLRYGGPAMLVITALLFPSALFARAEEAAVVAKADDNVAAQAAAAVIPPVVNEHVEYYEIKGSDEKALYDEMCKNGCEWIDGKKYQSVTKWRVKWDYGYRKSQNACSVDSFRTTVEITYRLPEWARNGGAPKDLSEKWGRYRKCLVEHEQKHRDIAVAAATELSRMVNDLPPSLTCADADKAVAELGRKRLKKIQEDSDAYDAATRHGALEGVEFP